MQTSVVSGRAAEAKRRLLIATTALTGAAVVLCTAATQFVAWRLNYHPLLGHPVVAHVYWPWAWLEWRNAAWAASTPKTFAYLYAGLYAAGALGTVAALKLATSARHKPIKHEGVHGTARFATESEIAEAGLLNGAGVYVGAWPAADGSLRYLMHDGPEHVLGVGPTRSAKTVAMMLPTLLSWPASTIVYDTKGELWEKTAGWRARKARNAVLRWEPAAQDNTVAFNPLAEVRLGTAFEFRDTANIVESIADPQGQGLEGHWEPTAAALMIGVALHVLYERRSHGITASLADVANALNDPARPPEQLCRAMVANTHAAGNRHEQIARVGQQQLNRDVKERAAVHSTAVRLLRLFQDPIIACNTGRSDFRINDLMNHDRPVSLYVVARGEDELRLRPLIRLFLNMAMGRLCSAPLKRRQDGQEASPHKHRLLMAIDEFASLRAMKEYELALSKCASSGIKNLLLVQDRTQIIDAYGPNESITSHCHIRAAYAPNNLQTAQWLSDMLGRTTIVTEDVTESGDGSAKRNYSRTYHTVSRPLMTADEIMRMQAAKKDGGGCIVEPGKVLVITTGRSVALATQSLYFRDPEFVQRAAIPAPATHRLIQATPVLHRVTAPVPTERVRTVLS